MLRDLNVFLFVLWFMMIKKINFAQYTFFFWTVIIAWGEPLLELMADSLTAPFITPLNPVVCGDMQKQYGIIAVFFCEAKIELIARLWHQCHCLAVLFL